MPPEIPVPTTGRDSQLLQIVRITLTGIGLLIAALGLLTGLFLSILLIFSGGSPPVDGAITGLAFIVLGVGLGGALAWHSSRAYRRQPSSPFYPLPGWILLILYIPVIAIGQLLISFELLPALTLPPVHILAAALPPLAILVFVGRAFKLADIRWREIIIQLSGGAFLATLIALFGEIILGGIVLVLAFVAVAMTPDGLNQIEQLVTNLQDPLWIENQANLEQLLVFPPISITLIIVFIILGPIIEEIGKLLGVALMSYRRPSTPQIFLWGLASGAGFGLIENLFNTTLALEGWILIMILRIGATAMHCLATGLTALGWQRLLVERRPWKLFGAYGLSVTLHAAWNALIIGITGTSVLSVGSSAVLTQFLSGGIIIILGTIFILLALSIFVALIVITLRLRRQLTKADDHITGLPGELGNDTS